MGGSDFIVVTGENGVLVLCTKIGKWTEEEIVDCRL